MPANAHPETPLPLRIARIEDAADGIRSFELVQADGAPLPPFTPGAHIKVQVPGGLLRKYSICNDPQERHRYVITVKRDAQGQGGSMRLVDMARVGDTLPTSLPVNAFALAARAKAYLFIAGGIGITPIVSMIRSLGQPAPVPWKLIYLTRSPQETAFRDELVDAKGAGSVTIHHDDGDPGRAFDLWPVLERPNTAQLYCCGPRGLMESVRDMTGHWSSGNVHFESFVDGGGVRPDDTPFKVSAPKAGLAGLEVPVGKSILAVLREHGCSVASSCESGTCGTCRTGLLHGEADHRDMVLLPEEFERQIMVCVSRAKSAELVLDL